jgi:hypothetical protein
MASELAFFADFFLKFPVAFRSPIKLWALEDFRNYLVTAKAFRKICRS